MANPTTYHAEWWVPNGSRRFSGERHTGTLTYYGDENSTLEVYHKPSNGTIFRAYANYEVIWGQSADGQVFTLFNAVLIRQENFSKSLFNVNYILIGAHIQSIEESRFDTCVSVFPYLRDWAFTQRISEDRTNDVVDFHLDMGKREPIASIDIENGVRTYLWGQLSYHVSRFMLSAEQSTNYNIEIAEKGSICQYLSLISEFSEFLSIALFSQQYPSEVKFKNKEDGLYYPLLFKKRTSDNPRNLSLIKFDTLSQKVPDMLYAWHSKHEQIAPIANYLIRSMRSDSPFDTPDFLIIAQALDGYFKRFVNKIDGKDTQKYKDGIDKLLTRFKDVEALQKCKIDSKVLEDCRNKYSHLYPDEEDKNKSIVQGNDLYWLTQKCKVLLTCCILEVLGLDIREINLCCKQSPIGFIINSLPLEL